MLSRVFGALAGEVGYQIPDYTAYQDMMSQARELAKIADNVVVKLPLTPERVLAALLDE